MSTARHTEAATKAQPTASAVADGDRDAAYQPATAPATTETPARHDRSGETIRMLVTRPAPRIPIKRVPTYRCTRQTPSR